MGARPSVRAYGPERPIAMRSSRPSRSSFGAVFSDLFPEKKYCKLTYAQTGTLNPGGAGFSAVTAFRCNSVHDPDWSGVGHQPKHHDILAAVYERYCVVSANIEVRFWSPDTTTSSSQCAVFVTTRPTNTDGMGVSENWANLVENGSINFGYLGFRDAGSDLTRVRASYDPVRMFGGPAINEDDNQALYGANPSKSPLWWIGVVPIDSAEDIGEIKYAVKITYNVISFRKKHDLNSD